MNMHLNTLGTVAVDRGVEWQPMRSCPTGAKVQLLTIGGVAIYGNWNGREQFMGWAPLPCKPQWMLEGRDGP